MTTETKGIEIKNLGVLAFGIILLLIGLVASFYPERYYSVTVRYPYQNIGIVLVVAGIIFVALGFFYSPRKTEPIKPST